jgi:hypothetical protein
MNINNNFKKILAVILFLFTVLDYSYSQTDTLQEPFTLSGHKFIVNSLIGSPFVNTYFKSIIGAGQTVGLEYPEITIKGKRVVQLRGEIVYTNLSLEYQQGIRDWMAFYGKMKLIGKLGTEAGAFISEGVNFAVGYDMGWKFKLLQNKKMLLSSNLNISNNSYTSMDMQRFLQNIIDSGGFTKDNKLVQFIPLVRGGIGFNYSYVFNRTFGATAKFFVDYGESVKREEADVFNYAYGIAFDADLLPQQNVPLGFLLGFNHTSIPQFKETLSKDPNEVLFQINYTGRKYLNLGAEISYRWYKPERENYESNLNFITFNLNSTIFF